MPYEVIAFTAASLFLATVTGMVVIGGLGFFGALRCGSCASCGRCRILNGIDETARCFRCDITDRLAWPGRHWHRHGHRLPIVWHH